MNPYLQQRPVVNKHPFCLLFAFVLLSADIPVQHTYILTKAYTVTILGTSNLRNWKDSVGIVTGMMVASLNEDGSIDLAAIHIKMEARSIKSDIGTALDNKTYRSLKADANPEILFLLDTPIKIKQVNSGGHAVPLKGYLTLAGMRRPVTMLATVFTLEKGKLQFEGSQTISMTDYGVKPPSALFGTIRAHPEITIFFKTSFSII
jgi:hypothetical protein